MQERAGETITHAQERAGELAGEVQERAQQVTHEAQRQVRRARGRFETMFDENPLGMGAIALAVGAAIGMMLPSTRREGRIMGEARDTLMQRGRGGRRDHGQGRAGRPEASRPSRRRSRKKPTPGRLIT